MAQRARAHPALATSRHQRDHTEICDRHLRRDRAPSSSDPIDITYAPAPGDTRSGFVTVVIVAKVTDGAQLNAKKVWASHPLARSEPVALPGIGVFTINGVTHSEMSRATVVEYQSAFVNMWTNIFERGFDKGTLSVYNASIFRHPRSSLRLEDATIVRVRDGASASPLLGRRKGGNRNSISDNISI